MRSFARVAPIPVILAAFAGCHLVSGVSDLQFVDPSLGGQGQGGEGQGGQGQAGQGAGGEGQGGSGGHCDEEGAMRCESDGTAEACVSGTWQPLSPCPLGCDEAAGACRVPSNVEPDMVSAGDGAVVVEPSASPLVLDTDTGEILSGDEVLRPAGEGLDEASGIAFFLHGQGAGAPQLGVFSMASLHVRKDAELRGAGDNALALLVSGDVEIQGTVTVAAEGSLPGPGGFAGGEPGAAGAGSCAGQPGSGAPTGHYCTSGSGGAGFGASGGAGGLCSCLAPDDYAAGLGGGICGTAELEPLMGGSGGAGGSLATGGTTLPGAGGAGGGAIQISAGGTIDIRASGIIHAGGGGGGESVSAGGAGGGAGGAILLEAPVVKIAVGSVLAANGGGGGGGDCA